MIVPSLTLDTEELTKLNGASYYEERLLLLLIRLRNPRAHVVYVTSQPVHPLILDYYLNLLAGVPASHARARLTMLCVYDASPRPLTQKILERPRLLQRIRYAVPDPTQAYLTVFNATPLERTLSVLLGIPLNGLDPSLAHLGTKSGSRRVFREAGIDMPAGVEDVQTRDDVAEALMELRQQRPAMRRALIKLNDSFSGEGNALVLCPEGTDRSAVRRAVDRAVMPVPTERPAQYFDKLKRMGGVVEEFVEAPHKESPSAQFRTSPHGEVLDVSTHDQILGGDSGQIYLGCTFPAREEYRQAIRDAGARVGEVLARHGVVSRYGVDFLAWRHAPDEPWRLTALEINLRVLGTTHPFLALRFLTGGELDAVTGQFLSLSQRAKCYRASDNLRSRALSRAAARGSLRYRVDARAALQPPHRVGRPVSHDRRDVAVRKAGADGDRERSVRSGSAVPACHPRARSRGDVRTRVVGICVAHSKTRAVAPAGWGRRGSRQDTAHGAQPLSLDT